MEKLNIICVDDQREVLSAVVRDLSVLESWVNIEECESAAECEALMDDIDSDGDFLALVISDHIMPGKTGVELLGDIALDGRFNDTRKILLTGQATHQDTINAVNTARIDHYFDKPWQKEELILAAKQLITHFIMKKGIDYQMYINELDQETLYKYLR